MERSRGEGLGLGEEGAAGLAPLLGAKQVRVAENKPKAVRPIVPSPSGLRSGAVTSAIAPAKRERREEGTDLGGALRPSAKDVKTAAERLSKYEGHDWWFEN